jgi:FkbM family methyltransferase
MSEPHFVSYAQNGEDVVLARALDPDNDVGFWIDVGAGDPVSDSITEAFAQRGWTGINIEPNVELHGRLLEHRPNEVNLACAAGSRAGFAKLYPGPEESPGLSTLVPQIAEQHFLGGSMRPEPVEVEVRALTEIAEQYAPPVVDFLKIDVEGYEREVLSGVDWERLRPRIVIVEAVDPVSASPCHGEWESILVNNEYRFALFDGVNRFYAAGDEPEIAALLAAPANILDGFERFDVMLSRTRAEEYVSGLLSTLDDERAQHDVQLADLQRRFVEAEEYARDLQTVRESMAVEMSSLARNLRLTSDRADCAEELAAGLRDDLAVAHVRAASALVEMQRLDAYVQAVEATRTFRHTRQLRAFYAKLRKLGFMR